MSTRWCCRILHEEFGPMDFEELRNLALTGTLGCGDLVRHETADVWRVASQCPELRLTLVSSSEEHVAESRHTRVVPWTPSPTETALPVTPKETGEHWVALMLTVSLLLMLLIADRVIASKTVTFPQPRRVREHLVTLHWFLGTGPWSDWEYWLLWLDSLVIVFFASQWITRRSRNVARRSAS